MKFNSGWMPDILQQRGMGGGWGEIAFVCLLQGHKSGMDKSELCFCQQLNWFGLLCFIFRHSEMKHALKMLEVPLWVTYQHINSWEFYFSKRKSNSWGEALSLSLRKYIITLRESAFPSDCLWDVTLEAGKWGDGGQTLSYKMITFWGSNVTVVL